MMIPLPLSALWLIILLSLIPGVFATAPLGEPLKAAPVTPPSQVAAALEVYFKYCKRAP